MLSMASCSLLILDERLRAIDGRHRIGPAGVEGKVSDHFDQLFPSDAVLHCSWEVKVHLFRLAHRDECCAGDEAPIALRKLRPFPDVAEQHVLGQINQLGRGLTERFAHRAHFFRAHDLLSSPCGSRGLTFTVAARACTPTIGARYGLPLYLAR